MRKRIPKNVLEEVMELMDEINEHLKAVENASTTIEELKLLREKIAFDVNIIHTILEDYEIEREEAENTR